MKYFVGIATVWNCSNAPNKHTIAIQHCLVTDKAVAQKEFEIAFSSPAWFPIEAARGDLQVHVSEIPESYLDAVFRDRAGESSGNNDDVLLSDYLI